MTMHKERNITFPELLQRIALYSRKSPMKAGERFDWRLRNDRNRRYESRDHIQGGRYGSHHLYFGYDGVAQGSDALVSKYIGQCPCSLWRSTYLHAWASHTHPIAPTSCATPGGNCRDAALCRWRCGIFMNVLWFFVGGIWIWLTHIFYGLIFCITIIGIPFGKMHFRLAKLALSPFGKELG